MSELSIIFVFQPPMLFSSPANFGFKATTEEKDMQDSRLRVEKAAIS